MVTESLDELAGLIQQLEDEFSQLSVYVPNYVFVSLQKSFSFADVMHS